MKNFKKITILFITLSVISYSRAMEERIKYIEDTIEALEGDIDSLNTRITHLEEASPEESKETFEKCASDGSDCKPIARKKAHKIIARGDYKHRIRRCYKGQCNWVQHSAIQKKFQALQQKAGIQSSGTISDIKKVGQQFANQAEFNRLRSQLNTLLSQDRLTQTDIHQINTLIAEFENKRPARRPSPADYKGLLQHKIKQQQ